MWLETKCYKGQSSNVQRCKSSGHPIQVCPAEGCSTWGVLLPFGSIDPSVQLVSQARRVFTADGIVSRTNAEFTPRIWSARVTSDRGEME